MSTHGPDKLCKEDEAVTSPLEGDTGRWVILVPPSGIQQPARRPLLSSIAWRLSAECRIYL